MPSGFIRGIEPLESRQLLASVPSGFSDTTIATSLQSPTCMAIAPDGRIFVALEGGMIRVIKNQQLLPTPFATIPDVNSEGERGLLGIELDPNFSSNGNVYVYYTSNSGAVHNRLARLTASGDVAAGGSQVNLAEFPPLNGSIYHNGGAMHFGPDGKLYVSLGDHNFEGTKLQTLEVPFGKILRFNRDGSIPTDGPWYSQGVGVTKAAYVMGLRNAFTFGFQPGTGRMLINDVGEQTWEEIDLGQRGANYGWPYAEGPQSNPAFVNPIYAYRHDPGCAIVGALFYNPAVQQFPGTYVGKYFFSDLCEGAIRTLDLDHGNAIANFGSGLVAPVDLDLAPDGSVYYLQRGDGVSTGSVGRISYLSGVIIAPSIASQPQSKTVMKGQSVTFSVVATGANLTFQWSRNSQKIPGATSSSYTIDSASATGTYRARVSNSRGTVLSNPATLTVMSQAPPSARIISPVAGTTFRAGQSIFFDGRGFDLEDGKLGRDRLTWEVDYITGTVVRPLMLPMRGKLSGTITIPTESPYKQTNVLYRIRLTVKDSAGATATATRNLTPITARVTLSSNVAGVTLSIDGQPKAAPTSFPGVTGLKRTIGAPPQVSSGGQGYVFAHWSDGGERSHEISTPDVDTVYTAVYVRAFQSSRTLVLRPAIDSYVDSRQPTSTFGGSSQLLAQLDADGARRDVYFKFDISSIDHPIKLAKLVLFGRLENATKQNVRIGVFEVSGAGWDESSINWDNRPTIPGSALAAITVNDDTAQWYEFDITAFLESQRKLGRGVVTLALRGLSSSPIAAIFNSREASDNKPALRAIV